MPKVFIVTLNWNGWRDTLECLNSLQDLMYSNFEIILVDNGSKDNSVAEINKWINANTSTIGAHTHYPINFLKGSEKLENGDNNGTFNLHFIRNDSNLGFSEGNNLAVNKIFESGEVDYILFLNNDTIVNKNLLSNLVGALENDSKIAAVTPVVYYYSDRNKIAFFGGKINFFTGEVKHSYRGEINPILPSILYTNFLEASSLLVRSSLIKHTDVFDKDYFAYYEDADLCTRLIRNGGYLAAISNTKVWHKVSVSSNPEKKAYYLIRNSIFFMRKNANYFQYFIFLIYVFIKIWYLIIFKYKFLYTKTIFSGIYDGFTGL